MPEVTWDLNQFDLQSTLEKLLALDISPFFVLYVGEDEKNNSYNILQVTDTDACLVLGRHVPICAL